MSLTLYHYLHCPFCVRVRMALGYLNLNYGSKVLSYDDEKTPTDLIGKKMLPILSHENGVMNESLDIVAFIDKKNQLKVKDFVSSPEFKELENFLNKTGELVHSLAMPFWMFTPEFSPEARKYFQEKKEVKRGPFKQLVKNQQRFIDELIPLLNSVENKLEPFFASKSLSLKDILIASHLWGLYIVPEFQFSPKMHQYLQSVKKQCHFNYQQDSWR